MGDNYNFDKCVKKNDNDKTLLDGGTRTRT